jgi:hypothetical protein
LQAQINADSAASYDVLLEIVSGAVAVVVIAVPSYRTVIGIVFILKHNRVDLILHVNVGLQLKQLRHLARQPTQLIEDARDPLLASLLTDNKKGIPERDLDDTFLLEPEDEHGHRDAFGSGASGSALRDGFRSGEARPDELQSAHSARVAAERQLRECRDESVTQRQKADARLQEEVTQREEADARYKELEANANAQREELNARLQEADAQRQEAVTQREKSDARSQRADEHARQMMKEIAQLKEGQHQAAAAAFQQPL